jgi:hypothetical protein
MLDHDCTSRRCLLSVVGLSLVLIPAALFAQTPSVPSTNAGTAPAGAGAANIWIALISMVGSVVVAALTLLTARSDAKRTARDTATTTARDTTTSTIKNFDWRELLDPRTIPLIQAVGRKAGFAIEGEMLSALMNEKGPDARRRLWQWLQDESTVAKLPEGSRDEQIRTALQFLQGLQALNVPESVGKGAASGR